MTKEEREKDREKRRHLSLNDTIKFLEFHYKFFSANDHNIQVGLRSAIKHLKVKAKK